MKRARSVVMLAVALTLTVPAFAQPGGARAGADDTPGWSPMTQQERHEHRDRMRSMQSNEECKTDPQQHHEQMAARAKERGGKTLAPPRRDACGARQR